MAAELPSSLRAVGAGRLLQRFATELGAGDSLAPRVLAVGLVGPEPALVTSLGGEMTLVHELPGADALRQLRVASAVAGETAAPGRWDAPSQSLSLYFLDNDPVDLSDVTFTADNPWNRPGPSGL